MSASTDPSRQARHTSHIRLFVILGVSMAALIALVVGATLLFYHPAPKPHCPEDCQAPPIGPPLENSPTVAPGPPVPTGLKPPSGQPQASVTINDLRGPQVAPQSAGELTPYAAPPVQSHKVFRAPDGSFSVAYIDGAKVAKNGVSWKAEDGVAMFYSTPSYDLTPRQIARQLLEQDVPNATLAYEIPNARVGYQAGYGEIDDFVPHSGTGSFEPQRVLIMVAVKNGLALVVEASGPRKVPGKNEAGHATGANFELAGWLGYFVNSFRWNGDPPR